MNTFRIEAGGVALHIHRAGRTIQVMLRYVGDEDGIRITLGFRDLVVLGAYIIGARTDLRDVIDGAITSSEPEQPITEE